jgi:hypothetical protein
VFLKAKINTLKMYLGTTSNVDTVFVYQDNSTVRTDFLNEAYVPPRTRVATHFSRY